MAFSEEWYETELKSSELETLHRPPTVEYSFYTAVKTGDMETVVANCKEDAFIHLEGTGVLSRNALTNIKYHFVVTAAMLTPVSYTHLGEAAPRWYLRVPARLPVRKRQIKVPATVRPSGSVAR